MAAFIFRLEAKVIYFIVAVTFVGAIFIIIIAVVFIVFVIIVSMLVKNLFAIKAG